MIDLGLPRFILPCTFVAIRFFLVSSSHHIHTTTSYLGPKKLDTVRYLIEELNADVNIQNKSGSSALILACGNEDCDPKVVRYLVEEAGVDLNRQINSKTTMWKLMRATARFAVNSKMTRSKFLRRVAESSGLTALHYAARRGDMEIVELLLEHGAKPSIRNDLGRDVLS